MEVNAKVCTKCNVEKEFSDFYKSKEGKFGLKSECKKCNVERSVNYNKKNKEHIKKYYELNKDTINNNNKKWRESNIDRRKEYFSNKKKTDELYRLRCNISCLIKNSFFYKSHIKTSKTTKILGCSIEDFKIHLESKFESWMSWDNYGKYNGELNYGWDIDHIIPSSSATTEDELIKLNHYTNLQPLCSKVNRDIKKARII